MVLNHVPQSPGFLIIGAAAFYADRLGSRDLYLANVAAIPQRLENTVTESKCKNVLDGFLAQVVIDSIDFVFLEYFLQRGIERPSRVKIITERLFHNDAPPTSAVLKLRIANALNRSIIMTWLRRQI